MSTAGTSTPSSPATAPGTIDRAIPRVIRKKITIGPDPLEQGFYWPSSEQKRREVLTVARNSPALFQSVYQARPGKREGTIFLEDDLNAFFLPPVDPLTNRFVDLSLGLSHPLISAFTKRGFGVFQAFDTAFSTTSQSAHTVGVTGLFVPCSDYHRGENPDELGPCEHHFDVLLLDVMRKRLDWGGLIGGIKRLNILWRPVEQVIEKKASGISAIQALESSGLPIVAASATVSKGDRALNSVGTRDAGSVQGWFRQHRVLTPPENTYPWIAPWRDEMKDFSGDDDASSDQVDATVHLITRAIVLGATSALLPSEWTPERSALPANLADPLANPNFQTPGFSGPAGLGGVLLPTIGLLPELAIDPYDGTCARCVHDGARFCAVQNRRMLALDSCEQFYDARAARSDDQQPRSRSFR